MDKNKAPVLFPVTVFEKKEESGIITRARARIFYKYANRNGGYITDEFADKLLDTLPGSPVKGIYSHQEDDFTDHGKERTQGRAYGFVPETNHNISYEDHEDEDGVTRTYACADVILWTSLYEEANDIIGAPQSMELYAPSVKGEWKKIDGRRLYVYTEGSFLGLQALGEDVEPCFEGAAFFSLFGHLEKDVIQTLYNAYILFQKVSQKSDGGKKMPEWTFRLSSNEKMNKIFEAVNQTDFRYVPVALYDEDKECILFDFMETCYTKVKYEIDEAADKLVINEEFIPVFADYLTEEEKVAVEAARANLLQEFETNKQNLATAQMEIAELEEGFSTLQVESENIEFELQKEIVSLKEENAKLAEFRTEVEKKEKENILDSFANKLDKARIEFYTNKLEEYDSAVELKKDLALEAIESNPDMFSRGPKYVLNPNEDSLSGISAILAKHKKK